MYDNHLLTVVRVVMSWNFLDKAQNTMVNQQDTHTWKSFVFERSRAPLFYLQLFPFRFTITYHWFCLFRVFGVTQVFLKSPLNSRPEIGPRPAKIYPLAHGLRLTAVWHLAGNAVHAACSPAAELNNGMLLHRYSRLKIKQNLRRKRNWHLKPSHFVAVEGIFLFPVFSRRKWIFENILRGFGGCSVKGNNT